MAYTCPKCGWKHKPSQDNYYRVKGLAKPICEDCNPSTRQRVSALIKAMVIGAFSNTYMGFGPLASIAYLPVVMLLPAPVFFVFQESAANLLGLLLFLAAWLVNTNIATRVGDSIRHRLLRGRPIVGLVLAYYAPLGLLLVGGFIFCAVFGHERFLT